MSNSRVYRMSRISESEPPKIRTLLGLIWIIPDTSAGSYKTNKYNRGVNIKNKIEIYFNSVFKFK